MLLEQYGLTESNLQKLCYKTQLGKSLKNTLRKFDKVAIINEIAQIIHYYEVYEIFDVLDIDYRIKSLQSCQLKYDKYYPNTEVSRTFNDILGFRVIGDYSQFRDIALEGLRIIDMTNGKAKDDEYRGIHLYYQISSLHYPIEIQVNSNKDREFNNWLHMYIYKYM